MPSLKAVTYFETTDKAFVWVCSDCDAVFTLRRMTPTPTITELHRTDSDFRTHCKHTHPGSSVIGLNITNPTEDASQAAVRIVREATEGH